MISTKHANPYTKLENLAWCQTVFLQFTFFRKRRFMKPLLLSSVAIFIHKTGCPFVTDTPPHDTIKKKNSGQFVQPSTKTLFHILRTQVK